MTAPFSTAPSPAPESGRTLPSSAENTKPLTLAELPEEITAAQAFEVLKAGEAPLVDIRSPMEWVQSGIPEGATPISIHEPGFLEKLDALLGGDKSKPFMLICRTGNRSPHIFQALKERGYSRVYEVPEGLFGSYRSPHPGWANRGLPLKPYNPYLME